MTDIVRLIIAGSRDFNDYELLEKEVDKYLQEILKEEREIDLVTDGEGNWYWCNWEKQEGIEPEDLPLEIVSGGARGADKLGERYAKENSYKVKKFIPDWSQNPRSAGMIRNIEMLKYSNYCILFWDGKSKGTKHTLDNAKRYNVEVKLISF